MHEQSKLVSGRLFELQQEANSEKAAHEFEKKIREQAQGDLQRVSSQLLHEANLRDSSLTEARQMKEELSSEKAEMTIAQQQLKAAYQEGRLLFVKVEKQEAQITKLIEDNKAANKTIVELKADIIAGASENFQKQFQQQIDQQDAVDSLKAKIEELVGSVKTLTSQNDALNVKNAVLEKELSAIKESSAMILEASREQNKKGLG